MLFQHRHRFAQRWQRLHLARTALIFRRHAHTHQDRQRRAAIVDVRLAVPAFQDRLRPFQIGVIARLHRFDLRDLFRQIGFDAVGQIEFVCAEFRRADMRIGAECLQRTIGTVCHVGLDAHPVRELRRLQIVFRPGRLKRRVVGIEHEAGFRIPQLRNFVERHIGMPDQVGAVARQDPLPVEAGFAHRELAVIDVTDIPFLIGIDVVDRWQGLQAHRRQPFFAALRLVEAIILLHLPHFVHAGIADGEDAMIGFQHRAVRGEEHVAMHRPDQWAPQLHAQRDIFLLEVAPFAVQQILVLVIWVDRQPIDVRQIGAIHRVRPAEMLVVSVQHEGRTGKEPARDMPAFIALQHGFVPGHRAGIRLVRIDEQPGRAIGGTRRRHRYAVGALRQFLRIGRRFENMLQRGVEAVEEWRLEHEARHHVLAGDG